MKRFKFLENTDSYCPSHAFIAKIEEKVLDENKLLVVLAKALKFPDYFGFNWNALYDCLRDFSWIENREILLIHKEFPQLNEQEMKNYLEVLLMSIEDWKDGELHCLEVVFPKENEEQVLATVKGFSYGIA